MLDNKGFDLWADGYDKSVHLSEENDEYPFAGYKDLLNTIYNIVHKKEKAKLLDIGFGTGILSKKLYDEGYEIYGIDFSQKMIDIAKKKMPLTSLIKYDFSKGLPEEIKNNFFDFIISTYALHHLDDKEKINFIKKLKDYINEDGKIIIGDIAFETRELLEKCKLDYNDYWDDEEIYFVFEEFKTSLNHKNISFTEICHCSGIIQISK
ncbi:MAG TPA: class I SAM-dependent methyltransferase [Tissierellaceae bacterium]